MFSIFKRLPLVTPTVENCPCENIQPVPKMTSSGCFALECDKCGAYIFGSSYTDDYPTEFFKQFFNELKTYAPRYIDSANKSLYYSMISAGRIYNDFRGILDKYYRLNKEDYNKRKVEKLKKEIEKLEGR